MGADGGFTEFVLPALLSAGGKVGAAALQPGAPVQPFGAGGNPAADALLTETHGDLEGMMKMLLERAAKPVSLPDAIVPGDLPTFSGGGLPFNIGLSSHPGNLSTPYVMPGADTSGFTNAGSVTSTARGPGTGVENPNNPDPGTGDNGDTPGNGNHYLSAKPIPRSFLPGDTSSPSNTGPSTPGMGTGSGPSGDPTVHALSLLQQIAQGAV